MIKRKLFFVLAAMICVTFTKAQTVIAPPTIKDQYSKKIGNLRFSVSTLNFGKVFNNETRTDTIKMMNAGRQAISLNLQTKNNYSSVAISKNKLAPEESGYIVVSYNFSKLDDYGFILDRIMISTDDPDQPQKNINITATVQEYFSPSDSLLPKAVLTESIFSYGNIRAGEKVNHDFLISNQGAKPLIVRKAKSSCGCIKTSVSKAEVAPGESTTIHVEFDSFGKDGKDSRIISVFLNDPMMPEVKLEVNGVVSR